MAPPPVEDVYRRIADVLGVPESRVKPEAALTDLVSDSYRLVELAIELQDDYDVIFSQADLGGIETVEDLARLVRSRVR